jgi:nitrogen fixation/metabolism regulation signal transduction histidine kinase
MGESDQGARPKFKRSAKNYLLDPHFQLKYTAFLVAIALVLSATLGALLWWASSQIVDQTKLTLEQSSATVKQGEETVSRGKQVLEQSSKVNQVVIMTMETCYKDDQSALDSFRSEAAKDDAKLKAEQTLLEADAATLSKRTAEFQEQGKAVEVRQRNLMVILGLTLLVLVVGIGLAGIVFTHKIAGPIFKMKRLLRQVGDGKLVLHEKLRKGDELQHFFETFETVVNQLRAKQMKEIERLDGIIGRLEGADGAVVADIKKLRADMQNELED